MIFDLTDEDREALEAIRKHRGHRSHAEALRELIRGAASSALPTPAQARSAPGYQYALEQGRKGFIAAAEAAERARAVDGEVHDSDRAFMASDRWPDLPVGPKAPKPGSRLKKPGKAPK